MKLSSALRYRPIREKPSVEADFTYQPCCLLGHQRSKYRIASPPVQYLVNSKMENTAVFLPVTPGHLKKTSRLGTLGKLPSPKAAKEKTTEPTVRLPP